MARDAGKHASGGVEKERTPAAGSSRGPRSAERPLSAGIHDAGIPRRPRSAPDGGDFGARPQHHLAGGSRSTQPAFRAHERADKRAAARPSSSRPRRSAQDSPSPVRRRGVKRDRSPTLAKVSSSKKPPVTPASSSNESSPVVSSDSSDDTLSDDAVKILGNTPSAEHVPTIPDNNFVSSNRNTPIPRVSKESHKKAGVAGSVQPKTVQAQPRRADAGKTRKEEKRPVVYTLEEPEKDENNNSSLPQGNLAGDKAQVDLMQDRGKRLEAALTKQIAELHSAEPRLLLMSVRSTDDEPPRLNLPSDGFTMVRHAAAVHRDVHDLQKLLKQEPLDNRMIVDAIGVITSSWKEHYVEPRPEDLVKLMSDLEDLVGFLNGNSGSPSFEELMVISNDSEATSLLQRYESLCVDASRDLKIFAEDKVKMLTFGKHLDACHADWQTKAEYYEKKAKEARAAAAEYYQLVKCNEEMIINHPAAVDSLSQKVENKCANAKTNAEAAKKQKEAGASAPPTILRILSYPCNPYFGLPAPPK